METRTFRTLVLYRDTSCEMFCSTSWFLYVIYTLLDHETTDYVLVIVSFKFFLYTEIKFTPLEVCPSWALHECRMVCAPGFPFLTKINFLSCLAQTCSLDILNHNCKLDLQLFSILPLQHELYIYGNYQTIWVIPIQNSVFVSLRWSIFASDVYLYFGFNIHYIFYCRDVVAGGIFLT